MTGKDLIMATLLGSGGGSSGGGSGGGSGGSVGVSPKEVNFYDYDGTCVHAYTVAEAQKLSALPAGPEHPGLVFQGWNWSLEGVNGLTRAMNIGAMYTTDDGTTRLYITLQEGRTSPMLGVGVNGTVTVDWGDGTEPDVLTGTSAATTMWTPNHAYAAPGDYVIRLTVDGEMRITGSASDTAGCNLLRYASAGSNLNYVYRNAARRIEVGENVTQVNMYGLHLLRSVVLPLGLKWAPTMSKCNTLIFISQPYSEHVDTVGEYNDSKSLRRIAVPENIKTLKVSCFQQCSSIDEITLPDDASLKDAQSAFNQCSSLSRLHAVIDYTMNYMFYSCYALCSLTFASTIASIDSYTFQNCYGMAFYDFTACTAVPTLVGTNAFTKIPADCEIRVPAALYDEWIAATNWSTYADYIKAY